MILRIAHIALLVADYDEAITFYCEKLGFRVLEDTQLELKRWVRLGTQGSQGSEILLSKAVNEEQLACVGKQAGGRVLFFLHTDNFERDYEFFSQKGIEFIEGPFVQSYGKVAVFKDLYGNRIDLIEPLKNS